MSNLKVGQSCDVVVSKVDYYAVQKGNTYVINIFNEIRADLHGIPSNHYMIENEYRKVGKLTITKVK